MSVGKVRHYWRNYGALALLHAYGAWHVATVVVPDRNLTFWPPDAPLKALYATAETLTPRWLEARQDRFGPWYYARNDPNKREHLEQILDEKQEVVESRKRMWEKEIRTLQRKIDESVPAGREKKEHLEQTLKRQQHAYKENIRYSGKLEQELSAMPEFIATRGHPANPLNAMAAFGLAYWWMRRVALRRVHKG